MDDSDTSFVTRVVFGSDARKEMFKGLEIAARAVGATLGPKGKTVIIVQPGKQPIVTKDGVTVSKSINLKDPLQKIGAQLVKEAASQTNDIAGDGTTTATILTHALVEEGLKLIEVGYDANLVLDGMKVAVGNIISQLKKNASRVTSSSEIAQVGTVSANGDREIGELISKAMESVGALGIITVEDAKGTSTSLNIAEGMQFERGYLSPYFVNNPEKMHVLFNDARVLVTDRKISNMRDLVPVLEKTSNARVPLLIIADDVEGEALQGLVVNTINNSVRVCAIKMPGFGPLKDALASDMCALTGAKLVSPKTNLSLDKVQLSDLGSTKRVITDAKTTTIVSDNKNKLMLDAHVSDLTAQLTDVTLNSQELSVLKLRIARLASGVAIIKVGGSTEIEMVERKHRIEDALNATRAATEEGIVPGGGTALWSAVVASIVELSDFSTDHSITAGVAAVHVACLAPMKKIVRNAGKSPDVVLDKLASSSVSKSHGYNASTGEYCDLVECGIIDPVKVTRIALENAFSVARVFLSLDAAIVDEIEK